MLTHLIVGQGYVGNLLANTLFASNQTVTGIRRSNVAHATTEIICHDLQHPLKLSKSYDYVYFMVSADTRTESSYRQAYIHCLNNLTNTLSPPKRFFFISSTSVYHQQNGEWADEQSATQPHHFSGKILLEAEEITKRLPYPATILRCSGIYGPNRSYLLNLARQKKSYLVNNDFYCNRIHVHDLVSAIHHINTLESPETIYNISDPEPQMHNSIVTYIHERLEQPLPEIIKDSNRPNKRIRPERLIASGFNWQYPNALIGHKSLIKQG